MKNFLKNLNWSGFIFTMILGAIGALSNKNTTTFSEWLFLMVVFVLPFSIFFLIAGRKTPA